ncbi:MAG: disulfide isomerase DsbC N-terminal domain-containing protein, partial [Gammaproteobacteria bacterium]
MNLPAASPTISPARRLPGPLGLRATALLFGVASLSACAQAPGDRDAAAGPPAAISSPGEPEVEAGTPEARARDAIRQLNSQVRIDRIGPAPVPGFREVVVGGQVVYVT